MPDFADSVMQSLGGDLGNIMPGYRNMRQQIVETQRTGAQGANQQAEAEQRRLDIANQKQQAQILQRLAQQHKQGEAVLGQAASHTQALTEQAMALIEGGQPAAGAKLLGDAALVESRMATARREQDTRDQMLWNRHQESAEIENQMWAGVKDQPTQDAAALQWSERFPQTQNPFGGMYDPTTVQSRRETTKEGLAWAREKRAEKETEARIKNFERLAKWSDGRERYDNEMLKIRKAAEERAAKGGVVKGASPELQAHAEERLGDLFPDLPVKERKVLGWEVASRAMGIVSANRGIDQEDALNRAIEEKRKDVTVLNENYKLYGIIPTPFTHEVQHYRPGEGSVVKGGRPIVGSVWDGHKYLGGDPAKKSSWRATDEGGPEATDDETGEAVSPEDVGDYQK